MNRKKLIENKVKYNRYNELCLDYSGDKPKEYGRLMNILFQSDTNIYPIIAKNL